MPALLFCILILSSPESEETVSPYRTVVTATGNEENDEGRSVTTVTAAQIEKKRKESVTELLRGTPGVHVATAGGAGGATTLFIRGGKGGHALVLLDGVRINDPSSVEQAADLSDILADGVDRIEVLRGPHAVVYGPDAMSGVVRIFPSRGQGPARLSLFSETGMVDLAPDDAGVNHLRLGAAVRGGTARGDYALETFFRDTGGCSAAAEADGNTEEDRVRDLALAGRFTIAPSDAWTLSASLRRIAADADVDNGPGAYRDDPNHTFRTERLLGRTAATLALFEGAWRQELALAFARHTADDRNAPDDGRDKRGFMRAFFIGDMFEASWRHEVTALPLQRVETGLSFLAGSAAADHRLDRGGPITALDLPRRETYDAALYLLDTVRPLPDLTVSVGGRGDLFLHRRHGTATDTVGATVLTGEGWRATLHGTYSAAAAYRVSASDTTLRASVANAFKPPSLFQLYSVYGSEFLKAEETLAVDGGVEQRFFERRLLVEATGFYQETRNAIEFSYGCDGALCGRYRNLGWLTAAGVETGLAVRPHRTLLVTANYTFTANDAFEVVVYDRGRWRDSRPVLRRPAHLANLWIDWTPDPSFDANIGVTIVGPRRDIEYRYPYEPVVTTLPTALLGSLVVSVRPTPRVRLFGRIENLFDRDDQLVKGFGTPGISLYLGFALDIGGGA